MFYKDEKIALLIDGPNTYSACKALGFDLDFKLLRKEFLQRGKLLRITFFAVLRDDADEYSPLRPVLDWMSYNGFKVVTRTARSFGNEYGGTRHKGSISIDFAIEAVELSRSVDHLVLFTGDGDYTPLVEHVKREGVRTTVVSTIKSETPFASDSLRRAADHFIDLDSLAETIQRPPRKEA